jgi:predicted alpha-1,6-mannanase (GH76 family)
MGLASLRAFQATNDTRYKNVADIVWADIKNGWSSDLGGGIWWNKDRGSKNACSNGPAAILGARVYKQFGATADLDMAKNIYAWEKSKLFNSTVGSVYDNMGKDGIIQTNPGWIFTYNQGTFLGAAYELYKITNDGNYLNDAIKAADYTIGNLVTTGILKSEGGGDGGLFKGIFVRYLTLLIIDGGLPADKKTSYVNFLKKNAETMWAKGTNKQYPLFNASWDTPPTNQTDLTTQLSGMMLIEATALLKKNNLF